ncbi:heme peroxidase [Onchocerca flexuosa]|uniref:Heme peroxidase n=1 Tax=Onchocerca flexuosa TaxID=387005 RepID=A0A238BQ99_9BILA|nr:heme peroxidase [Onchocerca flexuosa]
MIAQWAMFINEDIVHAGITTLYEGNQSKPLLCCNQQYTHPECYPIEVDKNDTIYSTHTRCLPYVRTATSPRENCSLGPREQVNQATSFLDASHIYGSTMERANKLRAYQNGGEFTNLFPTQTVLHTIWLRQHNNIAKQLKAINIGWDDEKLFQEARRIVVAQIQHITYNEFLPIIIGKNRLRQYEIKLRSNDYDSDYNLPGLHMNKYFKNEFLRGEGNYGLDLAAMIIQMGRDHGIPGYTAFRSACGLQRPTNFTDLADIVIPSKYSSLNRKSYCYAQQLN